MSMRKNIDFKMCRRRTELVVVVVAVVVMVMVMVMVMDA